MTFQIFQFFQLFKFNFTTDYHELSIIFHSDGNIISVELRVLCGVKNNNRKFPKKLLHLNSCKIRIKTVTL